MNHTASVGRLYGVVFGWDIVYAVNCAFKLLLQCRKRSRQEDAGEFEMAGYIQLHILGLNSPFYIGSARAQGRTATEHLSGPFTR